jgi:hypothetical protein
MGSSMSKFSAAVVFIAAIGVQGSASAAVTQVIPVVLAPFSGNAGANFNADTVASTVGSSVNGPSEGLSGATFTGTGTIRNGSLSGQWAAPLGDATNYLAIQSGQTVTISFATNQQAFGFFLGSADAFNTFNFFAGANGTGALLGTFTGAQLLMPGNGDQTTQATNNEVDFSGVFRSVVLASVGQNALELDNVTSSPALENGVPEPSTWAMMLLGFIGVGFVSYRRRSTRSTFRFA